MSEAVKTAGDGAAAETDESLVEAVDKIVDAYKARPTALIMVLQDIQAQFRYVADQALHRVAERLNVPITQLYGVATFYKAFTFKPQGRHRISVCLGTACHVKGGGLLLDYLRRTLGIEPGDTTEDGCFSFESVRCVGACSLAPVVFIDEDVYGRLTQARLERVLERYK